MIPLLWTVIARVVPLYAELPLQIGLAVIQWIASLVIVWLLYTRRSREWFTAVNS